MTTVINPYQAAGRGADTLGLIMEGRLQFRLAGDGTVPPFARRWRTIGGSVGWREALLYFANLYLDAGLIDYPRPDGRKLDEFDPALVSYVGVFPTRAGLYLFKTWRNHPFIVVSAENLPKALDDAARTLSAAYVEQSGLLEDDAGRYAEALRPHAEAVMDSLLGRR